MQDLSFELENTQSFIAGVSSLNGMTGDITITAHSIGATTNSDLESAVGAETQAREEAIRLERQARQSEIDIERRTRQAEIDEEKRIREESDNLLSRRVQQTESDIESGKGKVTTIESAINKTVINNIEITGNTSTDTINLSNGKVNIKTGATTSATVPFPVASASTAGIMNSATFQGLQQTTDIANGLLNGAVAVSGLAGEPTQAQLTSAWKTATGRTALMNRAVLYDITNEKLWTYYTNTSTWYSAAAGGGSVDVQPWTNSQAGIVKGSTEDGQIFAENDGTGSVNGWDEVKADIQNLEQAGYQTATDVANTIANTKVSDLKDGDDYATTASVNTGLATKQNTISDLETIRSGAALGATALQAVPNGYVKNTDYANSSTGGVIKTNAAYGTGISGGSLHAGTRTYVQYQTDSSALFIGKGTLDNVIAGKAIKSTWTGTQAEYDALTTYDDNVDYRIVEA